MDNNFVFALVISTLAGISTGIGSLIVIFLKKKNYGILSMVLGMSAGVMVSVSYIEILQESITYFSKAFGNKVGLATSFLAFFAGMAISLGIDKLLPSEGEIFRGISTNNQNLYRTGILAAIVITIHNLPEGIATFMSAVSNAKLAISLAIAIALHNIPEGMTIAAPIYFSTGNKTKAFFYSFITGLSEPLGAVIAYLILAPYINDILFGVAFGLIAGIMTFVSFNELIPMSISYGNKKTCLYGIVIGMAFMACGLVISS